jgi:hypothetical protein
MNRCCWCQNGIYPVRCPWENGYIERPFSSLTSFLSPRLASLWSRTGRFTILSSLIYISPGVRLSGFPCVPLFRSNDPPATEAGTPRWAPPKGATGTIRTDGKRAVRHAGDKAEIGFKVHPHMLRHACGYPTANKGIDTRTLQAFLGHRSINSTTRYAALAPGRFKNVWEGLAYSTPSTREASYERRNRPG